MGLFSELSYSFKKSNKLRKLQKKIVYNISEISIASDLFGQKADKRTMEFEEYLDLCMNDPNVRRLMSKYDLSRKDLERIYLNCTSSGLGKWVKGHYASLSTIAYYEPLRFYLVSEKQGMPPSERYGLLLDYWAGRIPQNGLHERINAKREGDSYSEFVNMTNRELIVELSWYVNYLLSHYIEIHDDIFKTSIRHAIPIPGIFKSIDFSTHLGKIENIIPELRDCNNKTKSFPENINEQERKYIELLYQYTAALIETVTQLKIIVGALYTKSQNSVKLNYDWKNYKNDLKKYRQSVQEYTAIGVQLNELFEKVK